MTLEKKKFSLASATLVAEVIACELEDSCTLLSIAGSIRRKKEMVGDIEIIYVPKIIEEIPPGQLIAEKVNKTEEKILELIKLDILEYRIKRDGTKSFGTRVKLLKHKTSQIPVDLFSCTLPEWTNNLVSRTGGKTTNITIASNAKRLGWNWLPFNTGFVNPKSREVFYPKSEREVFEFVRIPYLEPHERP
jgi:DNA polymerase/3'-5' exonuclease PolX